MSACPEGFRVAVKMSRYLTHIKRLNDPGEPVARFFGRAEALGDRLGPVLIQLPPTLKANVAALDEVLKRFPSHAMAAVEPRHPSWFTGELRHTLERHNAALCWADRLGRPLGPLWRTADFGYLRLHEGRATPRPRYGPKALRFVGAADRGRLRRPRSGLRLFQQRPGRGGDRRRHRFRPRRSAQSAGDKPQPDGGLNRPLWTRIGTIRRPARTHRPPRLARLLGSAERLLAQAARGDAGRVRRLPGRGLPARGRPDRSRADRHGPPAATRAPARSGDVAGPSRCGGPARR